MRAIGAAPRLIGRIIVLEGVLIRAASWLFGVLTSVPLSLLVGRIVGMMTFKVPLPLVVSHFAMALWLAILIGVSLLAGAWPGTSGSPGSRSGRRSRMNRNGREVMANTGERIRLTKGPDPANLS